MANASMAVLLVSYSFAAFVQLTYASAFLGADPSMRESMSAAEIKTSFLAQVECALGQSDKRYSQMETDLRPMFASLPKNEHGNLGHEAARYALHRIFVQRHGWFVQGLEPSKGVRNETSPAHILEDRIPSYVQALFEEKLAGKGLGLHELAVLASTLERFVHDEAVWRLSSVYKLLKLPFSGAISEDQADLALQVYVMMLLADEDTKKLIEQSPTVMIDLFGKVYHGWEETKQFVSDVKNNIAFAERHHSNPFATGFDYSAVENVVGEFGEQFGQFQNLECSSLKENLLSIEDGAGSGRVKLSDFYKLGLNGLPQLTESLEFLRHMGVLDETNPWDPHVVIANYLYSQSNCLVTSSFYSICCINECDQLLGHLEQEIASPTASPDQIIKLIENQASSTVEAPRSLSQELWDRLDEVASHHEGVVPLYGRLFAQWMHHAFPRECPYPQLSSNHDPMTADEWMQAGNEVFFSPEQMETFVDEACAANSNSSYSIEDLVSAESDVHPLPWMPVEELVLPMEAGRRHAGQLWSMIRPFMLLAALISMVLGLHQTGMTTVESLKDSDVSKYHV